jgi:uncharacterized protein (TIRG00374 family)
VFVAILVFVGGLALAAYTGGGANTLRALRNVPPSLLPVLLALSAVNYALRGARWMMFSRALRLAIPPADNALFYVAGFAMTTTPGKIGEALRLWLMNRSHGARYESTAAMLIADRMSDAVAVAAVVAITVGWFAHFAWLAALSVLIVGGVALLAMRPAVLLAVIDLLFGRLRRFARVFVRARRAVRALQLLSDPRVLGTGLLLGTLGWCAEAASFALLLRALDVKLNPMADAFVFGFAMMVGAISILPGGLGSTEATMVGLLASQGVPFPVALVATAVVRLTTLWFAVALGLIALPVALGRPVFARPVNA